MMPFRLLKEYINAFFFAIGLAVFIRVFLLSAYKVPSSSMLPALKPGDFIFASKVSYGLQFPGIGYLAQWNTPERGDVVVFSYPNQPATTYVKRIIAVGGDEVKIIHDEVIINGKKLLYEAINDQSENPNPSSFMIKNEKSDFGSRVLILSKTSKPKNYGPLKIPEGEVFVLGDNRDASDDSRNWGTVPIELISAEVKWVWLSLDRQNKWAQDQFPKIRWNRVLTKVQ